MHFSAASTALLGRFFALFNRGFYSRASEGYGHGVRASRPSAEPCSPYSSCCSSARGEYSRSCRAASSPPRTSNTIIGIVQLPDAGIAGPHRIRGAPDVAAGEGNPGRRSRVSVSRDCRCRDSSISATLRLLFFPLKALRRAHNQGSVGGRHRGRPQPEIQRNPGRRYIRRPAPAGAEV